MASRSSMDVMKALAMGAKGTHVAARLHSWAGGSRRGGRHPCAEILQKELHVTMGLCGEREIAGLGRHNLLMPPPPFVIPLPDAPQKQTPAKSRVAPDGSLHAVLERGTLMGNRGGRFHRAGQVLGRA
ncbi:MAG: alpha-hydroxy-acid oxidizing protein [Hyphomicrobiales bacterium]